MSRSTIVLLAVGGWCAVSALGMYRGCASAALPPLPEAGALARAHRTHFPVTLGVETYKCPVYSERLVESLRRTGLFDRVDLLEKVPDMALLEPPRP